MHRTLFFLHPIPDLRRGLLIVFAAIQGLGSGGSMSVTDIIFADMVPLPERGKFQGIAAAYVYVSSVAEMR